MRYLLPALSFLAAFAGAQTPSQTTKSLGQEVVPGVSESTDLIFPQISHRFIIQPNRPENPLRPGIEDPEGPNNLPVGGILNETRGTTLARFPGIGATGWSPPDPSMAIGPLSAVQVVNSNIAFFSRGGTKTFETDFGTFFASLSPGGFIFDPKTFYDWHSGRFVVCVLEQDDSTETSKVLFAISDDSDPAGIWHKYRLEAKRTINATTYWGDYPGFGYNKDGYAVALNLFPFSAGSFGGVEILAIRKSSVINGGAAVVTTFVDSANDTFSLQAAETLNPAATKLYMVNSATSTKLKVWTLSNLAGTPTAPTSQLVTVPSFVWLNGDGAPSPSGRLLDDLDGRLINVMYVGSNLVTAHTTKGATDDRLRVRWYELSIPPTGGTATLAQSGEVKETTSALRHFHMGAIAKSPVGDIGIIMTRSGASGPVADVMRSVRRSTDPAGFMGVPVVIESASGATYGFSGFNRWGDYAAVAPDPLNQRVLWGTHMTGASGTAWRTIISNFVASSNSLPAIASITFNPTAGTGGGAVVVGKITAGTAAPTNQTVTLSSSDTSVATVPASVTLPAETLTVNFNITPMATGVDSPRTTTITAVLNGVAFAKLFTVNPANLSNFTISASTVVASGTVTGTVTLNGRAGPAGRNVAVTSNNPAVVPASNPVVVPGTQVAKTFNINTLLLSNQITATITATLNKSVSRTLTVIPPPKLASVSVVPGKVKGGLGATATATLEAPAPIANLIINFSDNSAFVSMQPTAAVPVGSDHRNIPVTTLAVTSVQTVTITARFNNVVKTTTLIVQP